MPKAKVVNLVPGPSHDGVYTVSVSLLRVGVTSELRLAMQKGKAPAGNAPGSKKTMSWRVVDING